MSQPIIKPARALQGTRAYRVPKAGTPTDLRLDGNEGLEPDAALLAQLHAMQASTLRQYPDAKPLEAALAAQFKVEPSQVLVTAGADDALYRLCQAMLEPGRALAIATPTFEMIPRYAALTGAQLRTIEWPDGAPYPTQALLEQVDAQVTLIALVTPNNPNGQLIDAQTLKTISQAAPHAVIILDHAYVEFGPDGADLSELALGLPNVVVTRTFSKAWGLAGLRTGYALGPAPIIDWLRASGNPYAVTGPSLMLAQHRLEHGHAAMRAFVERARVERAAIEALLHAAGAITTPSHANFAFARSPRAIWMRDVFAGLGIAARAYPDKPELEDALRISCPGSDAGLARVEAAFAALHPEAILFDMDGVMVDVSTSYREAIFRTGARFGVTITGEQITEAKHKGDANNDWVLTHRLLAAAGVEVSLEEVTATFESHYQGDQTQPGLWQSERMLIDRAYLEGLRARGPRLAIVTGRPRRDAARLLEHAQLADLFEVVICMEDAPAKPHPKPVELAMARLGVKTAWMIGDTPDDMRSARAASATHELHVVPLGVVAPQERGDDARASVALIQAGAGRVIGSLDELTGALEPI